MGRSVASAVTMMALAGVLAFGSSAGAQTAAAPAENAAPTADNAVMLRERVNVTDFESDHFAAQLVERLGWAVSDADEVEHDKVDQR